MNNKIENKCSECGAYIGHSPVCSKIDFKEAKKQLEQYYNLWSERETELRKRESRSTKRVIEAYRGAEFWKGKFIVVKNENNKLRKKLYSKPLISKEENQQGSIMDITAAMRNGSDFKI